MVADDLDIYADEDGEIDIPRGMFTDTDRHYITGYTDYGSKQNRYARRRAAIERAVWGIQDLFYLAHLIEKTDGELIDEARENIAGSRLQEALAGLFFFLYYYYDGNFHKIEDRFESAFVIALQSIGEESGFTGIDIDIEPEYMRDTEWAEKKLDNEEYDELTPIEIYELVKEGKIDPEHLEKIERDEKRERF